MSIKRVKSNFNLQFYTQHKTNKFFNAIGIHIVINYEKLGRMDEVQAAFEHLKISDFKMWSSPTLKTFNNFRKMITNGYNNVTLSSAWCYFSCCYFFS